MYKCKLCGAEKETRRQMHGHLIVKHNTEYKESGYKIEALAVGAPANDPGRAARPDPEDPTPKPAGFRYLDKQDPAEYAAQLEGFTFIDDQKFCYTREEAREEGWI